VFASRSPHHPNHLGFSVVELKEIEVSHGKIRIWFSGVDLLDGTPVIDLKPYVPYADSLPQAKGSYTEGEIPRYPVSFTDEVEPELKTWSQEFLTEWRSDLRQVLTEVIALDPRPYAQKERFPVVSPEGLPAEMENQTFAFRFLDRDIHFRIQDGEFWVVAMALAS
jgi:hypothetical protein